MWTHTHTQTFILCGTSALNVRQMNGSAKISLCLTSQIRYTWYIVKTSLHITSKRCTSVKKLVNVDPLVCVFVFFTFSLEKILFTKHVNVFGTDCLQEAESNGQDDEQPPHIFQLHFYAFENVFDCLSLRDVVATGQTCKYLLNFAQEYFKVAFRSAEVFCGIKGPFIKNVPIDDFAQQIKNIGIWFNGMDKLQTETFVSVEKINLYSARIVPFILPAKFARNIKVIELHNCITSDDFYETFLNKFENLERLHIKSQTATNSIIGTHNRWLHEKYPKLIYFGLETSAALQMEDLVAFLSTNSQIANLFINSSTFSANFEAFSKSTIKLAVLTIKFVPWATVYQSVGVKKLLTDVFHLKTQKFCKQVTLIFEHCFVDYNIVDQLALLNLTELRIDRSYWIIDRKILAQRLVQLETLVIDFAYSDDILPFLEFSEKLINLTIKSLGRGEYLKDDILDMMGLSNIRRKIGAKMALFVSEDIYVCTKNGTRYSDSLLIELKRIESKLQ